MHPTGCSLWRSCTYGPSPLGYFSLFLYASHIWATRSMTILRSLWYLRLKQIKSYQAFRDDDKEHRRDAEAFKIPKGSRRHSEIFISRIQKKKKKKKIRFEVPETIWIIPEFQFRFLNFIFTVNREVSKVQQLNSIYYLISKWVNTRINQI